MVTWDGELRGRSGLLARLQMVAWSKVVILGMGEKEFEVDIGSISNRIC